MYLGRGDEADTGVVLRGGRPEPCEDTLREEGDGRDVTTGDGAGDDDAIGGGIVVVVGGAEESMLCKVATGGCADCTFVGGGADANEAEVVASGGGAEAALIPGKSVGGS